MKPDSRSPDAAIAHDSAFVCRYPDCKHERLVRSIWCEEHRYPQAREDGRCLATSCGYPRTDETPWCHEHTRRNEQAEELSALRDLVGRAAFVAEHLFQMIDPQTWRDSGGDDMQDHYEGDYHAEQIRLEIERWKEEVAR